MQQQPSASATAGNATSNASASPPPPRNLGLNLTISEAGEYVLCLAMPRPGRRWLIMRKIVAELAARGANTSVDNGATNASSSDAPSLLRRALQQLGADASNASRANGTLPLSSAPSESALAAGSAALLTDADFEFLPHVGIQVANLSAPPSAPPMIPRTGAV